MCVCARARERDTVVYTYGDVYRIYVYIHNICAIYATYYIYITILQICLSVLFIFALHRILNYLKYAYIEKKIYKNKKEIE